MSQFPSNPPFGQQPGNNAPSASSGPAPQQPGQPAWGAPAAQSAAPSQQPGQPAWGAQPGQQPGAPYGQQPGYYGAPPAAPAGPAAISKTARLMFVIGLGVLALAALFSFIGMASSGYASALAIIAGLAETAAWGLLAFGAWKAFDLVDALIAKSDTDKA